MLRSNTLFILGAGSSKEAGLPIGSELKLDIARRLDIRFEHGREQIGGDQHIVSALRGLGRTKADPQANFSNHVRKAWQIRDALPQAISIDNYIDAREDVQVEYLGKLAIASSIREAERESELALIDTEDRASMLERVNKTYYGKLFQLLSEGLRQSNADRIFENCSLISFNYDRSIEWFFTHAISNYFALGDETAQTIVSQMRIVHPYGTLGALNWSGSDRSFLRYGDRHGSDLAGLASSIRTFTEQITDTEVVSQIAEIVQDAKHIVFLGFGFHDINMQTIASTSADNIRRVFGTAVGVSNSDLEVIKRTITKTFYSNRVRLDLPRIELRNDLSCSALFDEYARSLRS